MKTIKWLFPALFIIALAGSAFTRQSSQKFGQVYGYYEDRFGYCNYTSVTDIGDNCVTDFLNYPCVENIYTDGTGWTDFYQQGFGITCYDPYYSYYPNH